MSMRASSTHTSAMMERMLGTLALFTPRITELLLRGERSMMWEGGGREGGGREGREGGEEIIVPFNEITQIRIHMRGFLLVLCDW